MNSKSNTFSSSYDEKALSKSANSSSLHAIVFLSYYTVSHCYVSNKPKSNCLITMSFLHASTHRRIYMASTLTPSDREDYAKYQISLEEYFQAKNKAKKKPTTKQRSKKWPNVLYATQ